jgi:ATP-binding cassette subfamily F protein uup
MSVLDAKGLKKAYGNKVLLDGVSLTIEDGERVGLVGRNGCGKTTMARILAEEEPSDGGTLARRRGARIGYLAQVPTLDGELTAWDVACGGLDRWNEQKRLYDEATAKIEAGDHADRTLEAQATALAAIDHLGGWDPHHRVRALLGYLGVTALDRPIRTMSGGEARRVALARLLVEEPDLAILDEPTNHLDADTVEWLEEYLLDTYKGAILFVTHDRYFLDRIVTRTLELAHGELHSYDGGYEAYLTAKAERAEHEARAEHNRKQFVKSELEWLRRTPSARTGKQKARIQRAETAIADKGPNKESSVTLAMDATRTGRTIVECHDLHIELGGRVLIDDFTMMLTKGERVGIVGPNGAGKSTLLKALLGELTPTSGEVVRGQTTKVAYLDQARSGLELEKSVIDNVAGGRLRVELGGEVLDVRGWLEEMLFDSHQQRQPVGSLSGGERARVLVARMLLTPSSLLVLDEPTNDLDTTTLSALETMLTKFDGTALVVTHDRYFLDRVATAIVAFEGNGRVVRYAGNYSMYRALRADREKAARENKSSKDSGKRASVAPAPAAAAAAPAPAPAPTKKKSTLTYGERIELDKLLPEIAQAEARLAELDAAAADPELFVSRREEAPKTLAALEHQRATVARLYARWEELEAKREG